jgi:hypothetical protein
VKIRVNVVSSRLLAVGSDIILVLDDVHVLVEELDRRDYELRELLFDQEFVAHQRLLLI